jgi:hypothetical protein
MTGIAVVTARYSSAISVLSATSAALSAFRRVGGAWSGGAGFGAAGWTSDWASDRASGSKMVVIAAQVAGMARAIPLGLG